MTGFVSQDAHALALTRAFDLQHLSTLEFHEPGVRQIERNCEAGDPVWSEPLLGQPDMRSKWQLPSQEFMVEFGQALFQTRALDFQR